MADLAQACSISKAALYHYFASKEAILFEALDDYTRQLQTLVLAIVGEPMPMRDQAQARAALGDLVKALLHRYADSHDFHVSLLNDVKFLGEAQRAAIRAQERTVVDSITALIGQAFPAQAASANRSAVTMSLLGMLNFSFAWWKPEGSLDADGLADLMIDLWFHGLASPEGSAACRGASAMASVD